jgi:UDP:flavonoid glycosyltransferase YjiC (YdhE family)
VVFREEWPSASWADPFVDNPLLDISPPSLRDAGLAEPAERISERPVSWAEPGDGVPGWVTRRRERPLAYLTLGTVVFGAVESLRSAVNGLAALDIDVLVTVGPQGDPAALGPVRDRVRVERFVPQDALLSYVDVLLHHCGSGTMLGGLACGIPQLALPHGADQFNNAEVLVRSGAGLRLTPTEITPDAVSTQVHALLTDARYRDAANDLAAEIAFMPAPAEVVPILERMTASRTEQSA